MHLFCSFREVFAFLPIRDFGFSFIIQSDFVTQAARQDIMEDSLRNIGLLYGIAKTFVGAVLQFCKNPTLQYQWMRYLPGASVSGKFWTRLLPESKLLLHKTPVLRPRSGGDLSLIQDMKMLDTKELDGDRNPLFDNLEVETYLDRQYEPADLRKLLHLGLQAFDFVKHFIPTVQRDLAHSISRVRTIKDQDWHSRVADLLSHPFTAASKCSAECVKTLILIPLEDGSWVSVADAGEIYFSSGGAVSVPKDLLLKLVKDEAVQNAKRKELFEHLGVTPVPPQLVRELLIKKYKRQQLIVGNFKIDLKTSLSHLQYSYYTHSSSDSTPPKRWLELYDHCESPVRVLSHDLYLQDNHKFGAWELLKSIKKGSESKGGLDDEFRVSFLNATYTESPLPSGVVLHQPAPSWKKWLTDSVGILQRPRFRVRNGENLSPEFRYIRRHRPETLLAALQFHWGTYKSLVTSSIVDELSASEVPCEGSGKAVLSISYLPLPYLKQIAQKFLLGHEIFPFLLLPDRCQNLGRFWNNSELTVIRRISHSACRS